MAKKLFIKTHGCQMNEYDSARMADLLGETHQYEQTFDESEADILLLNTCSIREKAQEKVFHQLGRWKTLKNNKPELIIGVGGCVASQEGERLKERAPYVDLIFGPQTLHRIPAMIDARARNNITLVDVTFPEVEKFDCLPQPSSDGISAYVSIMEGCSKYCTFCVVPYTRGEEVSRSFNSILTEIIHLAAQGVKEIHLLGQNVNAYHSFDAEYGEIDLAELIRAIAALPVIARIRFTTSHPLAFSERLIDVYRDIPQLVNHLHLPVQSGSDHILQLMKRGHKCQEYIDKIEKIRQIRPEMSFSSDFIIGFPGETEQDFAATMALIEQIGFDHSFSFIYSKRPGTPAALMADHIPQSVKKMRLNILQNRIEQFAQQISQKMLGSQQKVLVTGFAPRQPDHLCGRTENNRLVIFQAEDPIDYIGRLVTIEITAAFAHSLQGRLLTDNNSITSSAC